MKLRAPLSLLVLATIPLIHPVSAAELPARAVDPAATWDLTPVYANETAWRAAKDKLAADLPKIKAYEGRLGQSAATLREAMDVTYGALKELERLSVYALLR